jgi:hypothetical protein
MENITESTKSFRRIAGLSAADGALSQSVFITFRASNALLLILIIFKDLTTAITIGANNKSLVAATIAWGIRQVERYTYQELLQPTLLVQANHFISSSYVPSLYEKPWRNHSATQYPP